MNKKNFPFPIKVSIFFKDEFKSSKTFTSYPVVLGRSNKCDFPLTEYEFLSRQHCALHLENNKIYISDLKSSNGLYFENKKTEKLQLNDNLEIQIGDLKLKFNFESTHPIKEKETEITAVTEITDVNVLTVKDSNIQNSLENKQNPASPLQPPVIPTHAPAIPVAQNEKKFKKKNTLVKNKANEKASFSSSVKKDLNEKPALNFSSKKDKKIEDKVNLIKPHQHSTQLKPGQRVLEGFLTWNDQVYESYQFYPGTEITIGQGDQVNIPLPHINFALPVAAFDGQNTICRIPENLKFSISNETGFLEKDDLVKQGFVQKKQNQFNFKVGNGDVLSLDVGSNLKLHLRYAPAPRQLSQETKFFEDKNLKRSLVISAIAHLMCLVLILVTTPTPKAPSVSNLSERHAKLIVRPPEPPKPLPPPPPEPPKPKAPEPKVAKKEPPKKTPPKKVVQQKQPKPTKVVKVQPSKILKRVNRYPVEVEKPMKPAEQPVVTNVQSVGALAALNAFSSKAAVSNQPVAVNINKNAGGQTALNTGGVIGTLKTSTGKLAAGGLASVKTKGLGYGTGTGYGVQGIQGTAGGRAVAGTVVGAPSLVNLSKQDGLTRQQVMDVVKQHMAAIQQCYERSLIESPNLSGRVEYEWEITPKGSVQWAKVKKSEVAGGDTLNKCVTGVFKKMKFPVAKNGQNTIPNIGFPFGRL